MDWRHYVRERLPQLQVSAEREIEIVDELAVQLETTFERARANGATEDEAHAARPGRSARLGRAGQDTRPHRAAINATAGRRRQLRGTHDWFHSGPSLRGARA